MTKTAYKINDGVGILDLFQLLFVYLKLTEQIDWSWWWILIPLWVSLGIGFLIGLTGSVNK